MDVLNRVAELLGHGEPVCLVTVITSPHGSVAPGRKMLVRSHGAPEGSLGSQRLDREAAGAALDALRGRTRALAELGGGTRVFLDVLELDARVVICGAGHIALPLGRFARELGFAVTVIDDRPDFALSSRFPGCEVVAEGFVEALRRLPLGAGSYAVVITRGHEHDLECLAEILRKRTDYVGLIGSRRRVRLVLEQLGREGISQDRLDQVFTPIGLPIGAESPEEIALAVAAELVCVRRAGVERAREIRASWGGSP